MVAVNGPASRGTHYAVEYAPRDRLGQVFSADS